MKRLKHLCILAACLAAVFLVAALVLLRSGKNEDSDSSDLLTSAEAAMDEPVLISPEDFLPQNLLIGSPAPETRLCSEHGEEIPLGSLSEKGGPICLLFWASWCPDCTGQFQQMKEIRDVAASLGVSLILVDRVQSGRETVEKAKEKLTEYGAGVPCCYDFDEVTYQSFGMREIPGFVLLSADGIVLDYASGRLKTGEFEGLCRRAVHGRDAENLSFIESSMMNASGGVITSAVREGIPSGGDVLSESMGLYMLYAAEKGDEERFSAAYAYVETRLMKGGLCAWYAGEDGKRGEVNAFLDDLRIAHALALAAERWGGEWQERARRIRSALIDRCVSRRGYPVDFVDLDTSAQAETLSLCYLDLSLLEDMEILSEKQMENARALLLNGRISDSFPLYYRSYDFKKRAYSQDSLNISEALYTLWNLSRAGLLPDDALAWVKERVLRGDLAAGYTVKGEPAKGALFHSTGVYAMAALLGLSSGDPVLTEIAVRRMNSLYVLDVNDARYGSYGQTESNYYAFDQLIPLLVNMKLAGE